MLDTFVFEDHGVAVFEKVDGGFVGGLDLSHVSIIAEKTDGTSIITQKKHFFCHTVTLPDF